MPDVKNKYKSTLKINGTDILQFKSMETNDKDGGKSQGKNNSFYWLKTKLLNDSYISYIAITDEKDTQDVQIPVG